MKRSWSKRSQKCELSTSNQIYSQQLSSLSAVAIKTLAYHRVDPSETLCLAWLTYCISSSGASPSRKSLESLRDVLLLDLIAGEIGSSSSMEEDSGFVAFTAREFKLTLSILWTRSTLSSRATNGMDMWLVSLPVTFKLWLWSATDFCKPTRWLSWLSVPVVVSWPVVESLRRLTKIAIPSSWVASAKTLHSVLAIPWWTCHNRVCAWLNRWGIDYQFEAEAWRNTKDRHIFPARRLFGPLSIFDGRTV